MNYQEIQQAVTSKFISLSELSKKFERLPRVRRSLLAMLIYVFPLVMGINAVVDGSCPYAHPGHCHFLACDLQLRTNEAECLLRGYDPFRVWSGRVKISEGETYLPYSQTGYNDGHSEHGKVIHSYPPWSYTMIMPMMLIPEQHRFTVYTIIECSIVFLVLLYYFVHARMELGNFGVVFIFAISSLSINYIDYCIFISNYGILIAGFVFAALLLHRKGYHGWAGCLWAFTMVKPQIGLLFFLVLLGLRRWRTLFVGGMVVSLLSLPPALLCGSSPVDMILSIREYTSVDIFPGFGLITPTLNDWLVKRLGPSSPLWFGLGLGGAICAYLTILYAKSREWCLTFLPAIFLSTRWAVGGWKHDHALDLLVLAIVAMNTTRISNGKSLFAFLLVLLGIYARWWGTWSLPLPDIWSILAIVGLAVLSRDFKIKACAYENAMPSAR